MFGIHRLSRPAVGLLAALLPAGRAQAAPPALPALDDARRCEVAITAAEAARHVASGLMSAIGLVESGRPDSQTGRVRPWPWTINIAGTGYFFPSKEEAVAAVQAARASGVQSIDVGCMQINLQQHPDAFASLEDAFDPVVNATYAASFLQQLFARSRAWPDAAAAYHSGTPGVAAPYLARVLAVWPSSGRYVTTSPPPSTDDNCLPALRARMTDAATDHDTLAAAGFLPDAPVARPVGRQVAGHRWAMSSRERIQ